MNIFHFLYVVFLFVLLTPAILVRLPPKGNKWTVALVHGVIFSVILLLTNHFVSGFGKNLEGNTGMDVSGIDMSNNSSGTPTAGTPTIGGSTTAGAPTIGGSTTGASTIGGSTTGGK
jgi:hypothetical protein